MLASVFDGKKLVAVIFSNRPVVLTLDCTLQSPVELFDRKAPRPHP